MLHALSHASPWTLCHSLNCITNLCLSFDLRRCYTDHISEHTQRFFVYITSAHDLRGHPPPQRLPLFYLQPWDESVWVPEEVLEEGSLSFLAVLPCKPKGPSPYSSGVIMCWPPSAINPELMYAHQAGVMEEGEQTWHCGQLGVSEVRERECKREY